MSVLLNSDDTEHEEHLDYVRELLMYYVRKCLIMWIRVVWTEPNEEEEEVIPEVWVEDNMVHWPPGTNVTKAAKEM
ncbi:hypothetical protein QQF64_018723 [Cirrhinus molitorella]|uniref:Uncharacterized protein n=1 Tax=Cirrhinus molitorella TaxID=172907 RepID=A0ABR3LDG3_9TELE